MHEEGTPELLPTLSPEYFRNGLKLLESNARQYLSDLERKGAEQWDKPEMIAQATIALRSIEDARMRYLKVIQYSND